MAAQATARSSDQWQLIVQFSEIECDSNQRMTPGEFALCDDVHAVFRRRVFPQTERMHR